MCSVEKGEKRQMAIQSVSFVGREGCIKPATEKTAKKAEEFFNGRTPIENVKKVEEKLQESVDKVALESYIKSHTNIETSEPSADKIAEAYRAAHGIQ